MINCYVNGPNFVSNIVKGIIHKYKIQHKKSTPYHLQSNGQVESMNNVIESIHTKTVNIHKKDWVGGHRKHFCLT